MNYNNDAQDSLRPRTLQFPQLLHNSFCSIWFDIYFVSDLINFLQKSRSLLLSSKGHTIVLKIEPRSDVTSAQLFIGPTSSTAYTIRAIAKYHGSDGWGVQPRPPDHEGQRPMGKRQSSPPYSQHSQHWFCTEPGWSSLSETWGLLKFSEWRSAGWKQRALSCMPADLSSHANNKHSSNLYIFTPLEEIPLHHSKKQKPTTT